MYQNDYSCSISDSPYLETTQMSNNKRVNNEIVVYLYNGTLHSNEKEKSRHFRNMDLSHKNHGEQKEPDTNTTTLFHLHQFYLCKVQKQAKLTNVV